MRFASPCWWDQPRSKKALLRSERVVSMSLLSLLAQNDGGAGVLGPALAFMAIFWIVALAATIFWIWMLIDALVNVQDTNEKILWFLVIFFLHFIGAVIYF